MGLGSRAITILAILMGLSRLVPPLTAMVSLTLVYELVAIGMPAPITPGAKQPKTTGKEEPRKPNYALGLIQLSGVFGALAFVIWMERRRK